MAGKTKLNTGKKSAENKKWKYSGTGKMCSKIFLILLSITTVITAIVFYQIYTALTSIPDSPTVDLDQRWGVDSNDTEYTAIRPFRILFSEPMQEELRQKFQLYHSMTRKKSLTETSEYGTNSEVLGKILEHWQFKYSFRERERYMNQFDNFKTKIQGLDVHFVHVKPKVEKKFKVLPLLLLHGWPSSIKEFYEAIPLLTSPRPGYDFVFEVIAPSLPGFVYSQAPSKPGLSPFQIAIIMRNLMQRLGFKQYYIQGGDFGHSIGSHMATIFPEEVLGFHTNLPGNFAHIANLAWIFGGLWPSWAGELAERMYPLMDKMQFFLEEFGYLHLQATKPDTIGIALTDSPVGLCSYILDRFLIFSDPENKLLEDGGLSKYSKTDILDNIMLYWMTSSMTTAMRLYKESVKSEEDTTLASIPTSVPTWALRSRYEMVQMPDVLLRWKYQNLVGSTNWLFAGHYAAFERPKEFADDVFLAVKHFLRK